VTSFRHLEPRPGPKPEFLDPDSAADNLGRIERLVSASTFECLVPLLLVTPAPDAAVNQFLRFAEGATPELMRLLQQHPSLVHYATVVFGNSVWLGDTLVRNPDLFYGFARERSLDRTHSRDELEEAFARLRSRSLETDTAALLARFKRREYVRIMLRDALGIATLAETTAEISALADALIEEALRESNAYLQHRFGTPQHIDSEGRLVNSRFAVLSLGKLGGNELNYSSDIDLLYLYDGGDEPADSLISNREYFIRLAQQVTELLSRHTPEGPVFRIDLRLRPQGGEGEPAVPLTHAIDYYSRVAHDWELQAMIKARHSAGDIGLAREFVRSVQPFVYRPELNFVAIKTALATREKIGTHRRKSLLREVSQTGINVKLDPGGIRDIEFLVQCLQRVYGGSETWLRSRGTLFALQKLHDKEHISGKDFHNLTNAYEFLRNVEHRLQLRRGQQTHHLPQVRSELRDLARSLAPEGAVAPTPEEFLMHVQRRMAAVQEIYHRVIYHEQAHDHAESGFQLRSAVPATPENTYSQMMQRLAVDSPALREIVLRPDLTQHARRNLDRFLSSAGTTSVRYGAILRSPAAVERALTIFENSEFLTDILVRNPEEIHLLDRFEESRDRNGLELFSPPVEEQAAGPDPLFHYLIEGRVDRAEAMSILRQQYRRRVFRSGAFDLFRHRDIFQSLQDNTAAADAAIQTALAIGPKCENFAVMALGRLGTHEFDLLSDADLLFVCANSSDRKAVTHVAEQCMEALTAYTRDGTVFPVDPRLRPHGREGELVVTPSQLEAYFREEAKPWEALTYLKLRHVAGDERLAQSVVQVVHLGITAIAAKPNFITELRDVRTRLQRSESANNLKTWEGGSYDIDYLAGVLQARYGVWFVGNLADRLSVLQRRDLLPEEHCAQLTESARFLRVAEHLVRLVTGRARKWLPVAEHPRRSTQKLLWAALRSRESFNPEVQFGEVMRRTRHLYDVYLAT
jgi:[glutamine synthetase] adenylyltransferase / [glutamine synthetase]-adenylyl-L-tyrosine phosphorylase